MPVHHEVAASALTELLLEEPGASRCVVAPDGSILRVNAEWLRSTGFALEDVIGADLVELFPETRDMALAMHARARAGHRVEVPRHALHVGGRELWWEGSIAPVPMEGGTGLLVTTREVRPAEPGRPGDGTGGAPGASGESEAWFRLLSQAMPQVVCVIGPDGAIHYVNQEWVAFSGKDLRASARAGWAGVVHPDDFAAARECLRRTLRLRVPQELELRYRAADGSYRWFLSRLAPLVEGDRVVRLIGAGVEIEDRRRAEDALRAREAEFEVLIEELHSGVALIDAGGRFTLYNHRFLEMFGLARDADVENVNSQNWAAWQVLDEDGRLLAVDEHPVRQAARTRRPVHGRLVAVRLPAGGELRWMLISAEPVLAADGSVAQTICTYSDLTDRRRAEEALREANEALRDEDRRKDEFLGMLSHELRNPLAPIRNATYILRHAPPGGEQASRAQQIIARQTDHLARLVDDLLDVTRIARGKVELRRSGVDLREVVLRAAEDFRLPLDDRGVTFRTRLPDATAWAHVDGTRITQVLGNLLTNATKFTRRGDEVELSLTVEGDEAVVAVRDTGAGIDPALLPTIFDPFVQGARTLARTEGGLGLGLALVKGMTELHGGSVQARSAGRGKGSEFVVRLPLGGPAIAAVSPDARVDRRGGRRVLVVDDNADAAETLAELVRMLGYEVEVAYDGPAAVEAVRARPPAVVLCDIGLPGMDGYEVARAIRALGAPDVQLVAVSGYAQPEDVNRAIDAGFDQHVAKPLDPAQLERLLP